MAVIDIGPGATDRASTIIITSLTMVDYANAANDTGTLDTFEIFLNSDCLGLYFATFSVGNSGKFTSRDYEAIGKTASGSKQTFTGKNCDVTSGDYLGAWISTGTIERDTSGGSGVYYLSGFKIDGSEYTYSLYSGDAISIYATGATAAAGNPYYYYLNQ